MCGFLACFKIKNTSKVNFELFQKALDVQKMRGPDFSKVISEDNYFLGHNRLSILDQDPRSNQPYNKNKYFSLIYNGEIYNISELREFLFSHKIYLESNCDTEILYELLINFGIERTMSLIEGMYAFVFIDKKMDRVVGGRDKFGQKPIFYLADNTDIIFSSSINSIRVLKPSLKINSQAIENYLASQGHILTSETFFSNILPLNAGHYFILENNKIEINRYFAVEDLIETNPYNCSEAQALEDIENILCNSVKEHLNADCKVGMLLSGGIDSMLIGSYLNESRKDFSFFTKYSKDIEKIPDLIINNKNYFEESKLEVIYPSKKDYLFKLIDYIKFAARPAPWGGGPPMMDLCRKAKENGVKVLLSGDCVDEFTAGYSHSSLSLEKFNGDFSLADKLCNVKYLSKGKKFIEFQNNLRTRLMNNMRKSGNNLLDYFRLNSCHNIEFHLQETNLPHSDTYSMIESIELRNPYLDLKFLKYILNLNIEKIYNNWNNYQKTGKFILKKLAYKKYAKDFGDEYFLNKEGTRNYSYYVSDKKFWNLNNFISVNLFDKEFNYYEDWRFFYNLINLEFFIRIFFCSYQSKTEILNNLLTSDGKKIFLI